MSKSDKTAAKYGKQVVRQNRELQFVKLGLMKVSPMAQRELKPWHADDLASRMDIDSIGTPEVSFRDGYFYVMDGQHRVEALKVWLGQGWEDQHIQCWVATGLSEEDEANAFLRLNHRLSVNAFQKFKVAVRAGRPDETAIERIVKSIGLTISQQSTPGAVGAVGTLMKVYGRNGEVSLRRALSIARDAYGDPGLDATIIDGFGLLCHRYNGSLDEASGVVSLGKAHGGANGLLGAAEQLRQKTGNAKNHCVAAAAVQIINRDRKGANKLPDWWKN